MQISLAAAAVSVASYALFPQSPIFFGILHCIALSSLIALPLIGAPWPLTLTLGVVALAAPAALSSAYFDTPPLWWTGLSSLEPASNDYRPLFPWLGFLLIGLAAGRISQTKNLWPSAGDAPKNAFARALGFGGRHSLVVYLVHQPIFLPFWPWRCSSQRPIEPNKRFFCDNARPNANGSERFQIFAPAPRLYRAKSQKGRNLG